MCNNITDRLTHYFLLVEAVAKEDDVGATYNGTSRPLSTRPENGPSTKRNEDTYDSDGVVPDDEDD